jgi:hypothetical protein
VVERTRAEYSKSLVHRRYHTHVGVVGPSTANHGRVKARTSKGEKRRKDLVHDVVERIKDGNPHRLIDRQGREGLLGFGKSLADLGPVCNLSENLVPQMESRTLVEESNHDKGESAAGVPHKGRVRRGEGHEMLRKDVPNPLDGGGGESLGTKGLGFTGVHVALRENIETFSSRRTLRRFYDDGNRDLHEGPAAREHRGPRRRDPVHKGRTVVTRQGENAQAEEGLHGGNHSLIKKVSEVSLRVPVSIL